MLPTEHSGDKLLTSTTTTAFCDSEVQHVATSATQNGLSETLGNDDELGNVPPAIPGTVGKLRDTTSPTAPTTISASSGEVQEALGRPMESVSVDPEGMLSLPQPSREKSDRLEVPATDRTLCGVGSSKDQLHD